MVCDVPDRQLLTLGRGIRWLTAAIKTNQTVLLAELRCFDPWWCWSGSFSCRSSSRPSVRHSFGSKQIAWIPLEGKVDICDPMQTSTYITIWKHQCVWCVICRIYIYVRNIAINVSVNIYMCMYLKNVYVYICIYTFIIVYMSIQIYWSILKEHISKFQSDLSVHENLTLHLWLVFPRDPLTNLNTDGFLSFWNRTGHSLPTVYTIK